MNRYAAKLLFQYRADIGGGRSNVMRTCEERIIVIFAKSACSALRKVKAYGKEGEFTGESESGHALYFEFVGVVDLLELGLETMPEEVWYDIVTKKQPSERRDRLIPQESCLNAIYNETRSKSKIRRQKIGVEKSDK
jgi:hypothetical protein